jgi:SAM-dependent methyltransferase
MSSADYKIVGQNYSVLRKPDPRIGAAIWDKLEGIESVVNIGAGTGSYEPPGKYVVAVEPSEVMIAQRENAENSSICQACAEKLPFASDSFEAAMAILTLHHWEDWKKGLQEAVRVSRNKIIILTWVGLQEKFWLFDYFPELERVDEALFPSIEELSSELGGLQVLDVPIPSDCTDGFLCAYWARPLSYLDDKVRSAISTFSRISDVESGLSRLAADLGSGEWDKRYGHLTRLNEKDFGYRLVVASR